jgi:hypothetical protein
MFVVQQSGDDLPADERFARTGWALNQRQSTSHGGVKGRPLDGIDT